MSGVADTVHEDDDIHDDEYLISQSQAKKVKMDPVLPLRSPSDHLGCPKVVLSRYASFQTSLQCKRKMASN